MLVFYPSDNYPHDVAFILNHEKTRNIHFIVPPRIR